jgi:hypothetical protein
MPRRKLSWSLERSRIQADRTAVQKPTLTWTTDLNSFGDTIHFGRDANGTVQGTAFVVSVGKTGKIVANAYTPGTMDLVRLGEWPMSPVGLRLAQVAVEGFGALDQAVAA